MVTTAPGRLGNSMRSAIGGTPEDDRCQEPPYRHGHGDRPYIEAVVEPYGETDDRAEQPSARIATRSGDTVSKITNHPSEGLPAAL
jgi:hypothetical protein